MPAEEGRCTAYAHIRRFKLRCRAGCRARICCSDRGGWAHLPQNLQLSPRRKLCRADAGYLSGPPARLQLSTVLGLEREQVSAATAGGGVKGWGCFFRLILSQRGTLLRQQLDVLLSAPSRAFLPRRGATFYPLPPLLPTHFLSASTSPTPSQQEYDELHRLRFASPRSAGRASEPRLPSCLAIATSLSCHKPGTRHRTLL